MGTTRGLVIWNFDECGAPLSGPNGEPTYFQHGLSRLVLWRWAEARRRFAQGDQNFDLLPVVVICGTHASRMTLLKTASGRARIFDMSRAQLWDEPLTTSCMDLLGRIAEASDRAVPETAKEVSLLCDRLHLGHKPGCLILQRCIGEVLHEQGCIEWVALVGASRTVAIEH